MEENSGLSLLCFHLTACFLTDRTRHHPNKFYPIMCTLEKRGNVYILTLTGSGEHRLNPTLIDSIKSTLDRIRAEPPSSPSILITTAKGKFFSNGLDLAWARSPTCTPEEIQSRLVLMLSKLRSLISDLMSFPMPTIAAVTGHASAAGMILALSHDYVVMRKDRGFLYMSELDIGGVIVDWFMAVLNSKIGDAGVRREVVLAAAKLTAVMAVERGLVYSAHNGVEETVGAAVRLGEELVRRKWDGHVYAGNRMALFRELLDRLRFDETVEGRNGNTAVSKL